MQTGVAIIWANRRWIFSSPENIRTLCFDNGEDILLFFWGTRFKNG